MLRRNSSWWLLLIIIATILLTWYNNTYIISDSLYYFTYGEKLSNETIEQLIDNSTQYRWLSYLILPFVILLRILYTSTCIYAGCFFSNKEYKFSTIWGIAVYADTVFVLAALFNILYLTFFPPATISEISLNPSSILYYLNLENIPPYLLYPIGLINLFEFIYWGVLAYYISHLLKCSSIDGLGFIYKTYGVGLLLIILILTLIII